MNKLKIGDKASLSKKITKKDIELFSEITGDRQALHYDEELAKRLGYNSPIAQGGVITGVFNAIVAHQLPGEGSVFLNVNWNFRQAVCIGDTIAGEVEVLSVRIDKPIIELKTTIINQDGVICVEGTALVYKRDLS
ncbi:MAG TPA: MaoC family dehydratase [Candidatus Saccharimonadales bacterium]|nr:MaoC family dehydratase [Candidatus Saccharimonadales bacterium]